MKRIAVYCGSSIGSNEIYKLEAQGLGTLLANNNIDLVYGGAKVGLMGTIADAALAAKGKVIGVLPTFLQSKEIVHEELSELIIVDSMHERKTKMYELADGFIALPGGFGTLEELFEMLTWGQLGLHQKPIGLLNTNGYYDALITLIQTMVNKEFLKPINQEMLLISSDTKELLELMSNYKAQELPKWIRLKEV